MEYKQQSAVNWREKRPKPQQMVASCWGWKQNTTIDQIQRDRQIQKEGVTEATRQSSEVEIINCFYII